MTMAVMQIVIVRMRVRNPFVGMLMGMRCAGRRRHGMGVVVVLVVVGVFVRMRDCTVGVRVRVLGHGYLLGRSGAEGGIMGLWIGKLGLVTCHKGGSSLRLKEI